MKLFYNRHYPKLQNKAIPRTIGLLMMIGGLGIGGYAGADQLQAGIDALVAEAAPSTLPQLAAQEADAPALILLDADAMVLTNDGSSTTVTARVRDEVGQPVAGASIDFFQTTGGVTVPESTTTNDAGEVSVTFTAGSEPGQAVITASVTGANQAELTQTEIIQIVKPESNTADQTLSLNFTATTLKPGQQLPVAATLRDGSDQPLAGELVSFFGSLGQVLPASAISDANGQVSVQYTAGTVGGSAKITALSGVASASVSFQIQGTDVVEPTATPTKRPSNPPTATPTTGTPTGPAATPIPDGSGNAGGMQDTFLPIVQ